MLTSLTVEERSRQAFWHALPEGWPEMPYQQFLAERRRKLADVVRKGFEQIGSVDLEAEAQKPVAAAPTLQELIHEGESSTVEFKATARWSLNDNKVHDGVEFSIVRTIAGFLNTNGGTLVIGVADDGAVVGLEHDYATLKKKDRDGFELFLYDLLGLMLGKNALPWLKVKFERVEDRDVAIVRVQRSPTIVFTNPKGQKVDDVYVRFGNSTRKLTPAEVLQYLSDWTGSAPVKGEWGDLQETNLSPGSGEPLDQVA